MTLVIKNDSKSAKNNLKTQGNLKKNYQKFQLKKLACPVMITEKRRKNSWPVQLKLSRYAGGVFWGLILKRTFEPTLKFVWVL